MSNTPTPPRSLIAAALVIVLFMSFFVLEITDSFIHHRQVARSAFFFPPTAILLWGVLTRRRWAWFVARGAMVAGVLAFGTTGIFAAFFATSLKPRDQNGIIGVSIFLCTLVVLGFVALGRPATRRLFGIGGTHEQ